MIALLGNPFSPRYARARARPLDHCAMHVALRGPNFARWALVERVLSEDARRPDHVAIGSSRFGTDGQGVFIEVDEKTTPGGKRVLGSIRIRPDPSVGMYDSTPMSLDPGGSHVWWPVAPVARAEVTFRSPELRFEGAAYADANAGRVPLESTFASWCWSRASIDRTRTVVGYDVALRRADPRDAPMTEREPRGGPDDQGVPIARSLLFGLRGFESVDTFVRRPLAPSAWGLARSVHADEGARAHSVGVERALEDGPCYARALVRTRLVGRDVLAMHEVLSGDRLRRAWVRFLLGFKMGRGR